MRLVTFLYHGRPKLGALHEGRVVDLATANVVRGHPDIFPATMIDLLAAGEGGLEMAAAAAEVGASSSLLSYALEDVTLLPPILRPGKVIALGRNYAAHAKEGGSEPPPYPMLFHKTASSLIGSGQKIVIPPVTNQVDFEGELAVIIGRNCYGVAEADALDYVAGYTISNDVTARDWQRRTSQFTAGKMVDTFGPLGPALVTPDEVGDVQNLRLQTYLNGELMQDGNTQDMLFSVAFTISYITQIVTLEVGDVILTGTPEGVGFARTPPVFMQPGDVVSVTIERLGTLTNPVVAQG